jgi:hypothetical protein
LLPLKISKALLDERFSRPSPMANSDEDADRGAISLSNFAAEFPSEMLFDFN